MKGQFGKAVQNRTGGVQRPFDEEDEDGAVAGLVGERAAPVLVAVDEVDPRSHEHDPVVGPARPVVVPSRQADVANSLEV